jgi:ribosome-binding ATPase YchF (GTP1/OBG family)
MASMAWAAPKNKLPAKLPQKQTTTKAPEAAGEIHSDIQRGFIKAEIMGYNDLKAKNGDEKAMKEAGLVRQEGKEYVMADGDIVHFKFNV